MTRTILIAVAAFLVGALAVAGMGTALAWGPGPGGQGWGPFGGMMGSAGNGMMGNGNGMMGGAGGGMMGGSSMMGGAGMMGGWSGQAAPNQGTPIALDKAVEAVQSYVARTGNNDLAIDEVMEFQNNFYASVKEKSTGAGAFELLVDRYTGSVFPEHGPNMMWNTKYGMMGGQAGGMMEGMMSGQAGGMMEGMMSGTMGAMMGGQNGPSWSQPTGEPTVTAEKAAELGKAWLDKNQSGSTIGKPDRFYGYYTLDTKQDGKISGMLSVNACSGQVWYHNWHGDFIQMRDLGQ